MRIFLAGVATESNSFAVMRTGLEDFDILRGSDVAAGRIHNPSLDLTAVWGPMAAMHGDELIFSLMAWANPSGITQRSAYEALRDEILADLHTAGPVDIVLLMLHGAMIAEGYPDCERDLIGRVREIVGDDCIIGAEFDLHGHVSSETLENADIVVAYKEYPHTDINDRAVELYELATSAREGHVKPVMALVDCRMVGQFPTSKEPLRGFVRAMQEVEGRDGVLSVSFIHGFRCGDVPNMGAKMLVVADNDPQLALDTAEAFARRLHAIRREISFFSFALPVEVALTKGLSLAGGPIVIADQADNQGSGGPGDSTFALRWLLDHGVGDAALGILYDPEVVRIARKAGVGARLCIRVGGKLGTTSGLPVDMDVEVSAFLDDYQLPFPQDAGDPVFYRAGDVVALRCGTIDLVVNSKQVQCYSPAIFTALGIDLSGKKLVVVKSSQHFYGAFAPIAREIIYMTSPGSVPPDPRMIHYEYFDGRQFYPWVDDPFPDWSNP